MSDTFPPDNVEELFELLDEERFSVFSNALAAYRSSLMKKGFTRRESIRLVEGLSRILYEMLFQDAMDEKFDSIDPNDGD